MICISKVGVSEAGKRVSVLVVLLQIGGGRAGLLVCGRASLRLALVRGQVTPIWPPTGIALLRFSSLADGSGRPSTSGGAGGQPPHRTSPLGAAFIAAGNTLAPLTAAALLKRAGFRIALNRLRDAAAIIVLGALVAMTISATFGTSVLVLWGGVPLDSFWSTWAVWWTGDAMGVLLVAPFILSLLPKAGATAPTLRAGAELIALLLVIGVATYLLFQNSLRLEYLVFPLIMLAALRFRLRGAAPAALIASGVAIWAAVQGTGPFVDETLFQKMVTLRSSTSSSLWTSFVLAAFIEARTHAEAMTRLYVSTAAASQAKSSFLNMAAHELRTPLTVFTGYLSLLSADRSARLRAHGRRPSTS